MSRNFELLQKLDAEHLARPASGTRSLAGEEIRLAVAPLTRHTPDSEAEAGRADWLRGWVALRKNWRQSLIFAGSVMAAVVLLTILTKPVYTPVARVEIDPPGAELFSLEGRGGPESAPDYLETQARNMSSDELLISVMRQLQLQQLPEFRNKGLVSRSLGAVLSAVEGIPTLLWGDKGAGKAAPPGKDLPILSAEEASTLRAMKKQLAVERDTASRLVNVSFTSHDPVLSASITNTLVRSFIERTYQTRHAAIMESTEWLSRQLDDIRAKMGQANRELADFQLNSGIADIDENRSTVSEQMGELSRQKTQAQAERIQLESYLNKVRRGQVNTLPQVQSNQMVQVLSQRLAETRAELSQTMAIYGKKHPYVTRLENQAQELELQIGLQQKAILGQMETSYAAAISREHMIDSQLRGTAKELGQMARYSALKKEAQANSDLYNALYARVKEAGIAAASKSINIRIIDQARVLNSPTSPRPLVNLGIGLCIALIGGVLVAFVREAVDTKVRTLEDVRQSIGISSVSTVPIAEGNGTRLLGSFPSALSRGSKLLERPALFLLDQPGSRQSEAFWGLHASVMLSQPNNPPRVLLVASSLPGEGKTTVAINLAIMLSRQGKTCIVDADLRRPSIGPTFHLGKTAGLGDYLLHSLPAEAIMSPLPNMPDLSVVTAGEQIADPGKLFNPGAIRLLVESLRTLCDFVVIDSPPILTYADGRTLAAFVDGVVFVSRAGMVTREAMSRSLELLEQVHSAPILEVVLNGAATDSPAYGYRYRYGQQTS
ncbi:MAG: GumC family protein [Chlamydiota bacterium]